VLKSSLFILLFAVLLSAASEDADRFRYEGAPTLKEEFQPYDRFEITLRDGDKVSHLERFGEVRSVTYAIKSGGDFERYAQGLRRTLLERAGGATEGAAKGRHYFKLSDSPESWLYLSVARDWYAVKLFRQKPYPEMVTLRPGAAYVYSDRLLRLGRHVPENALIPQIKGFVISEADFKRLDRHGFETGRGEQSVEGETWSLSYERQGERDGTVRRFALLHDYRDLLRARGTEILAEDAGHFVFRLRGDQGESWGMFGCGDYAARLLIVRATASEAEAIMDINALKNALDASGHVALRGIYFDTAKAVLKPASDAALAAAAALLRRFPDMKLAIEGHTDNVGDAAANKQLSLARAAAVQAALERAGIAPGRLTAVGFGEERPVASNAEEKGRAANRRVELRQRSKHSKQVGIDATFFQPMHDARNVERLFETHADLTVTMAPPFVGRAKRVTATGDAATVRYVLMKEGRRDRTVSGFEIVGSFKKDIALLGGKILASSDTEAFFIIPRGDGKRDVYGRIDAGMGAYRIRTVAADSVSDAEDANRSKKRTNNSSLQ